MYLSWRIISLENATEFHIFCHTLSEALTLLLQYYLMFVKAFGKRGNLQSILEGTNIEKLMSNLVLVLSNVHSLCGDVWELLYCK